MSNPHIIRVEPGLRIAIPAEWEPDLGEEKVVSLERTAAGILVRPWHGESGEMSWDEFFADKLTIGSGQRGDSLELTRDDYLF